MENTHIMTISSGMSLRRKHHEVGRRDDTPVTILVSCEQ